MYEAFYGLNADPFRLSSDPRFCFNHHSYARAKAYVQYALHRAEGFVMITGKPGTGKTTLVYDLLETLPAQRVVAGTLVSTQLEADDLLLMTGHSFGLEFPSTQKALVLQRLTEFMAQQHRQGRRSLLIIDEAQDLAASALEELRLLTNLQRHGEPLLQIALLGQEPLRDLVRRPEMQQVHQRLIASWRLEPLDPAETIGYVRHRLERAGWTGDPAFEPGVLPIVHAFSAGVPRRINLICSRLLLKGFIEERHTLNTEDAETVVQDLYNEDLALLEFEPDSPTTLALQSGQGAASILGVSEHEGAWAEIDRGLFGPQDPRAAPAAPVATTEPSERPETPRPKTAAMSEPPPVEARPQPDEPALRAHDEVPRFTAVRDPEPSAGPEAFVPEHRVDGLEPVVPMPPKRVAAGRGWPRFAVWAIALFALWLALLAAVLLRGVVEDSPLAAFQPWRGDPALTQPTGPDDFAESAVASAAPERPGSAMPPAESEPRVTSPRLGAEARDTAAQPGPPSADPALGFAGAGSARTSEATETARATPPAAGPEPSPAVSAVTPDPVLATEQILFRLNSTTVDAPFESRLAEIAQLLEQTPEASAIITGYTDRFGPLEYNLALSRQRAQAVANRLIARGIAVERLRVEGHGPRDPDPAEAVTREEERMVELMVVVGADS